MRLGLLVPLLGLVLAPTDARASTEYPAEMKSHLPLSFTPDCSLCHGTDVDAGTGTSTKITFAPTGSGNYSGSVSFDTVAEDQVTNKIVLTLGGYGVSSDALNPSPSSLAFGISVKTWGLRSVSGNHELCTCTMMRWPRRKV